MPSLEVTGALLHFETFGQGPLLLLIPGADGRGAVFHEAAKFLAENFTVICWDRRGYSQSLLLGAQDFNNRLSTEADDAHSLITHLSPGPANMFGSSSGAIVAQRLLERHPESVTKVIAHEPPALSVLPEEIREIRANAMFWFEFELRRYTSATVDLAVLELQKNKYVPAAGMDSGDGPGVGPIALIAQKVGVDRVRIPGGHIGFMTAPKAFASSLLGILN